MNINIYTDDNKYNMHLQEYKIIWENEGQRIIDSFEKITTLKFKEKELDLLINSGLNGSNSAGETISDKMIFRCNNRCKIGTFLHELSHRFIIEYDLENVARKVMEFDDIHEVIDLFLYDVIVDLYGKDAADMRVEYESNFDEEEYRLSWEKTLKLSFEERQELLKRIIKEVK